MHETVNRTSVTGANRTSIYCEMRQDAHRQIEKLESELSDKLKAADLKFRALERARRLKEAHRARLQDQMEKLQVSFNPKYKTRLELFVSFSKIAVPPLAKYLVCSYLAICVLKLQIIKIILAFLLCSLRWQSWSPKRPDSMPIATLSRILSDSSSKITRSRSRPSKWVLFSISFGFTFVECLRQCFSTFFHSRHPFLIIKQFGGTPRYILLVNRHQFQILVAP